MMASVVITVRLKTVRKLEELSWRSSYLYPKSM